MTVGQELATMTGYKLFHNHVDNSRLSPVEAARRIASSLNLPPRSDQT